METSAETSRIQISFKRKDKKKLYFTEVKKENTKKERKCISRSWRHNATDGKAEAAKSEGLDTWRAEGGKGSSSKAARQGRNEEPQEKTTFIVLQKNTRSLSSSERQEEMICELHCVECDAILISETWRQTQEISETQQGHIMVESGQFINKQGVAILLNKR